MTDIAHLSLRVDTVGMDRATAELDRMASKAKVAEQKMFSVAQAIAALGGAGLTGAVYNVNKEFQRLHTQLQTFAGLQGADAVFSDLQRFATETPFELRELTEAWISMKARGMDPSVGTMRSVGNAASALGVSFAEMNGAIASAAAGETETLRRLGFAVQAQGDSMRIAYDGMAMTVDKNARAIQAAVASISEAKFAGGMERQVLTLGGAMSNLKDQVDATLYSFGKAGSNSAMTEAIQGASDALKEATPRLVEFGEKAVTGAVDATKFVHEHKDALLALASAYGSLKVGSIVGGIATETAKWTAAKQAAIGQALIAKSVIVAEAEADRLAATAKAEHAAVHVALARLQANTAPAMQQVAAQTALRTAVNASTTALKEQIAAEAALMTAQRSAGMGAAAISALGGPIGLITGLLTLGATAWVLWGDSAEDAAEKAKKAAQEAAQATGTATTRLYDQVRALEQQKRDLVARNEAGQMVGDNRFAKADAGTIKRVRELMDSRQAAEGALAAIDSGQMRFKDINERVHAESRYAQVVHNAKKAVEDLATAEAKRLSLNREIAGLTKEDGPTAAMAKEAQRDAQRQIALVASLREEYGKLTATEAELLQARIQTANLTPALQQEAQSLAALITLKKSQVAAERELSEGIRDTARAMDQVIQLQPKLGTTFGHHLAEGEAGQARAIFNQFMDPRARAIRELGILQRNADQAPDMETYKRAMMTLRSEASITWGILKEGGDATASAMANAFAAWATGARLNVREMTRSILADLARITAQRAIVQLVDVGFQAIGGAMAGASAPASQPPMGVSPEGLSYNAWHPTIPTHPQAGPTTVSPTVTVNIHNSGTGSPTVTAEGAGRMGDVVSGLIQRAITDECRPGGAIWETARQA